MSVDPKNAALRLPTLNQDESASANGLLIMLPPRQNCQTWIYITPKVRWTEWQKEGMTGGLTKEIKWYIKSLILYIRFIILLRKPYLQD